MAMTTTTTATCLALVMAAALAVSALPVDPEPSLKHDTDVGRLARPTRMFLVDLIRPPASTADPLLTNEVDTSADGGLPRLVRLLVADRGLDEPQADEELDEASEDLTRLRPPAVDQQPAAADWGAPSAASSAVAAPSEELLPPAAGQADEWTKFAAQSRADDALPAASETTEAEAAEPSAELQPPSMSSTGVWELFEGLKMVAAGEAAEAAASEPKAERRVDGDGVPEPATELLPPPAAQPDSLTGLTAWTSRRDSAAAPNAAPVRVAAPELPEPATYLLPPAPDSYVPQKPSSGEAAPDDFLTMGAAPPAADSAAEYVRAEGQERDSYLPEAAELRFFGEGPVVDDFLTIGEPPKETASDASPATPTEEAKDDAKDSKDVTKDSYSPEEAVKDDAKDSYSPEEAVKDSYLPEEAAKDDTKDSYLPEEAVKDDAKDSYLPETAAKDSDDASVASKDDAKTSEEAFGAAVLKSQAEAEKAVDDAVSSKEHTHDQDHDHEYVRVDGKGSADSSSEEDGGEVSTAGTPPHRERLLLGKLAESGER